MAGGNVSNTFADAVMMALPDTVDYLMNDELAPLTIRLFDNDIEPDPAEGNGQFSEASFGGYAGKAFPVTGQATIVVLEPNTGNRLVKLGPGVIFQCNNVVSLPATLFGWYITSAGATSAYLAAGRFTEPIVLTTLAQYIEVEPSIRIMLDGLNSLEQANL